MALRNSRFLKAKASCRFVVAGLMETDELGKDAKGLAVSQDVQVQFSIPCLDRDLLEFAEIGNIQTSFISGCYDVDKLLEPNGRDSRKQIVILVATCFDVAK